MYSTEHRRKPWRHLSLTLSLKASGDWKVSLLSVRPITRVGSVDALGALWQPNGRRADPSTWMDRMAIDAVQRWHNFPDLNPSVSWMYLCPLRGGGWRRSGLPAENVPVMVHPGHRARARHKPKGSRVGPVGACRSDRQHHSNMFFLFGHITSGLVVFSFIRFFHLNELKDQNNYVWFYLPRGVNKQFLGVVDFSCSLSQFKNCAASQFYQINNKN